MNRTSRCVKVTFSVVGTRTLEYVINEDKEYQGKIYFTFDKEKATNENTIYVGIDGKYYIRDEMFNREVLNKDVYFKQLGLVPEDSKVVEDNVAKLKELVRFINIDNYVAASVASEPVFTVNISGIDHYNHSFNTVNTFHYLKNENVLVKEYREIATLVKEMSN